MSLRIDVIQDLERFVACRDQWNALATHNPCLSWEWLHSWWSVFGDDLELAIAIVSDESGRWVGAAPWYHETASRDSRSIRLIGSRYVTSDYLSFLSLPGFEKAVGAEIGSACLSDGAISQVVGKIDLIELEGFAEDDLALDEFISFLGYEYVATDWTYQGSTWKAKLPESWQDFESSLTRSFRRKTRTAQKRLDSAEITARTIDDSSELSYGWETLVDLHQKRRASLGKIGCFENPQFASFLRLAVSEMINDGRAQFNLIDFSGRSIAICLLLAAGDTLFMYQSGMDPSMRRLEPGHLIVTHSIQQAIQRGYRQYDFLRGDDPYKARWNTESVGMWRARFEPARVSPFPRH